MQYLLDYAPYDSQQSQTTFDVKQAAKQFSNFVRKSENLLDANLVYYISFLNFPFLVLGTMFNLDEEYI